MKTQPKSLFTTMPESDLSKALLTPWKLGNELKRWGVYPYVRIVFALNGIPWGSGWRFYGVPIIQKHRQSSVRIGEGLQLRSSAGSNPIAPNHAVVIATRKKDALIEIGANYGMTGGTLCAAEQIRIGDHVAVGANTIIIDTDFHPLDPMHRRLRPSDAKTARIVIEDNVFIGMNCMVLKGVTIGQGSVIGAGSVVTKDVPPRAVVAGNPARIVREL